MARVIPAVIPASYETLVRDLGRLSFAPAIQIDVVDGQLAAPASWPYEPRGNMLPLAPYLRPFTVMVDLMVRDVMAAAQVWLSVGVMELVVHHESAPPLSTLRTLTNQYGAKLYFAADDEVSIAEYQAAAPQVDGFQLMGIDVMGQQGQPFSPRVVENVRALRAVCDLPIVIDGSVNQGTIRELKHAGATDFVVGSAILAQADPRAAYQHLCTLVTE
jgi:pentose-5-phosphate-3-epimerase